MLLLPTLWLATACDRGLPSLAEPASVDPEGGPVFLGIRVEPPYVKEGDLLTVSFSASRALAATPAATVGGRAAACSGEGLAFTCTLVVAASDGEGEKAVVITGVDVAGYEGSTTGPSVTFDFTAPSFTAVFASPAVAGHELVQVDFVAAEALSALPVVRVAGVRTSVYETGENQYFAVVEPTAIQSDGDAEIVVAGVDLAGNANSGTAFSGALRFDFTPPAFTDVMLGKTAVGLADLGDVLTITFATSEELADDPVVTIGVQQRLAELVTRATNTYAFEYVLAGTEDAVISIRGADKHGNQGEAILKDLLTVDYVPPPSPRLALVSMQQSAPGQQDALVGAPGAIFGDATLVRACLDAACTQPLVEAAPRGDGSFGPLLIGDNAVARLFVVTLDAVANVSNPVGPFANDIEPPVIVPDPRIPRVATRTETLMLSVLISDDSPISVATLSLGGRPATEVSAALGQHVFLFEVLGRDGHGLRSIEVQATDAAGNSASAAREIELRNALPLEVGDHPCLVAEKLTADDFVIGVSTGGAGAISGALGLRAREWTIYLLEGQRVAAWSRGVGFAPQVMVTEAEDGGDLLRAGVVEALGRDTARVTYRAEREGLHRIAVSNRAPGTYGSFSLCVAPAADPAGTLSIGPEPTLTKTHLGLSAPGDFNGDGATDLAIIQWSPSSVDALVLLLNDGGTLTEAAGSGGPFVLGSDAAPPAVADFNGDGVEDIAVASQYPAMVQVLLGRGADTLGPTLVPAPGSPLMTGETSLPVAIVAGDANRDGHADLLLLDRDQHAVLVYLGRGDGSFSLPPQALDLGVDPGNGSFAGGDFNGDGRIDVALTAQGAGRVYLGLGDGTFSATAVSIPSFSGSVADVDLDGRLDLVGQSVLLGRGDGSFASLSGALPSMESAVADVNADGIPDLVAPWVGGGAGTYDIGIEIARGRGDGSFSPAVRQAKVYHTSELIMPLQATAADVNGDGLVDVLLPIALSESETRLAHYLSSPVQSLAPTGASTHAVGPNPRGAVVADLDGDAVLDLVAIDWSEATQSWLGDGLGGFTPAATFTAAGDPQGLAAGDFDDDGKADVVISTDTGVRVYFGDGSGAFPTQSLDLASGSYEEVAVADFNLDGHADLALVKSGSPRGVQLLAGDGDGGFSASGFVASTWGATYDLAAGDLDNDGDTDVVLAVIQQMNLGHGFIVLKNDGAGTLGSPALYECDQCAPQAIAVGDLDSDGVLDVVLGASEGYGVYLGVGDGSFTATSTQPIYLEEGGEVLAIAIADVNADYRPDLLIPTMYTGKVWVLTGRGDGSFVSLPPSPLTMPAPEQQMTEYVVSGDLDDDGAADLVAFAKDSPAAGLARTWLGGNEGTTSVHVPMGGGAVIGIDGQESCTARRLGRTSFDRLHVSALIDHPRSQDLVVELEAPGLAAPATVPAPEPQPIRVRLHAGGPGCDSAPGVFPSPAAVCASADLTPVLSTMAAGAWRLCVRDPAAATGGATLGGVLSAWTLIGTTGKPAAPLASAPVAAAPGLVVRACTAANFTECIDQRTVPRVAFDFASAPPHPLIGATGFSMQLAGQFRADLPADYLFSVEAAPEDKVVVSLAGSVIIDATAAAGATLLTAATPTRLARGWAPLRIEYVRGPSGTGKLVLRVKAPHLPAQVVRQEMLGH